MSQKANPKRIGAFVLGAVALLIVGVVVFGSGKFFQTKRPAVVFFEGSVGGLQVGAPVNFRGVRVGSVTDIQVIFDAKTERLLIPVFIEFEPDRIQRLGAAEQRDAEDLIRLGFRGKLGMQSFVTGQLSVEFDFYPDSPVNLVGVDLGEPELPTLPSDMEQLKSSIQSLAEKLAELDLGNMVDQAKSAITAASSSIQDIHAMVQKVYQRVDPMIDDLSGTLAAARATMEEAHQRLEMRDGEVLYSANAALGDARELMKDLDTSEKLIAAQVQETMIAVRETLKDMDDTLAEVQSFVANVDKEVEPISKDLQTTLLATRETLEGADTTLQSARSLITNIDKQVDPLVADAKKALQEAAVTLADARTALVDFKSLARTLDKEVGPLSVDARKTVEKARTAMDNANLAVEDVRKLIANVNDRVGPMANSAEKTLDDLQKAVSDARAALSGAKGALATDSVTMLQLNATLREIDSAARAIRFLAEYLERNPNSVLTGKN